MISPHILVPRASLIALLVASSALAVACDANPIGGGGEGGEGGGASVASGPEPTTTVGQGGHEAVGGGPAVSHPSIALYGDQIPPVDPGDSTSVGVGGSGPGGDDDDRLVLFLSRDLIACDDPFGGSETCPEAEEVKAIISLPPEYQAPGTYDLDDPQIRSSFSLIGPDQGGGCYGGGGSFFEGTIQIVSIEDDRVRLVLDGTTEPVLDGQHTAFFCGGSEPDESSAISFRPNEVPAEQSGTGGNGVDDRVTLVFADHAQSCADPYAPPGPGELHHEYVIRLPDPYLVPGTYLLDDPFIEVGAYEYEQSTAAVGGGGMPGSLTINEVGEDYIDLELSGTGYDYADGAIVVPRCYR